MKITRTSALVLAFICSAYAVGQEETGEASASAVFAGGCFWCMEPPFDKLEGVRSTTSGYIGGNVENPSYEEVSAGGTGHAEAVRVVYNPTEVSYEELLSAFWRNIDPLDAGGQFCDRGDQYRSAIFYENPQQRALAEESKNRLAEKADLPGDIVTEIVPAGEFYPAEDYHQNYYQEHPIRYRVYRFSCGRDDRLAEVWTGRTDVLENTNVNMED